MSRPLTPGNVPPTNSMSSTPRIFAPADAFRRWDAASSRRRVNGWSAVPSGFLCERPSGRAHGASRGSRAFAFSPLTGCLRRAFGPRSRPRTPPERPRGSPRAVARARRRCRGCRCGGTDGRSFGAPCDPCPEVVPQGGDLLQRELQPSAKPRRHAAAFPSARGSRRSATERPARLAQGPRTNGRRRCPSPRGRGQNRVRRHPPRPSRTPRPQSPPPPGGPAPPVREPRPNRSARSGTHPVRPCRADAGELRQERGQNVLLVSPDKAVAPLGPHREGVPARTRSPSRPSGTEAPRHPARRACRSRRTSPRGPAPPSRLI